VVACGTSSKWPSVISGVPQDSVLGPMLFIIYVLMIYVPDVVQSYAGIFADNTKIYRPITSPIIGYDILQSDINSGAMYGCLF